ncbi:MAG: hypothetical protein ACYSTN_10230 [Planctomycetota bacterium]
MNTKLPTKNTPRGDEQNSLKDDGNITYDSGNVKGWPESGPDSAKTPKNDTEKLPPDLVEITAVWPELPEHIKAAIKALIKSCKEIKL